MPRPGEVVEGVGVTSSLVTAIAAVIVAFSALITNLVSYRKTQAETEKLRAEAEKIRSETAEIDSKATNAEIIARQSYQLSPLTWTLYDSCEGFSLFDFGLAAWDEAAGQLALDSSPGATDDVLVLVRSNTAGTLYVLVKSYNYKEKLEVIPTAGTAASHRLLRVRCQVRTYDAQHTFLPTLKMEGAPAGKFLGQRRHRISPGPWMDIDDHFEVSFSENCCPEVL